MTLLSAVKGIPSTASSLKPKASESQVAKNKPYLSVLASMFVDLAFRKEAPKMFKDVESICGTRFLNVFKGWRWSRDYDDIPLHFYPDSMRQRRDRGGCTRRLAEVRIQTAYKPKAKKVQPVNANDGTGGTPGGKADWYERSKARDFPQEHIGKYKDHLMCRITSIPRGSRLTQERLKALDIGDWL